MVRIQHYLNLAQAQRPTLILRCRRILGPDHDVDTAEYIVDGVIQRTWARIFIAGCVIQNIAGYLTNGVTNDTRRYLRDAPKELFLEDILAQAMHDEEESDYDLIEGAVIQPNLDIVHDVQAALGCLTPIQQRLVQLVLIDGLSQQAAAESVGLKWGMEAGRQLKPAIALLREKLHAYKDEMA